MKRKHWLIAAGIAGVLPIPVVAFSFLFSGFMMGKADQWAGEAVKLSALTVFLVDLSHFWQRFWWLLSMGIFAACWAAGAAALIAGLTAKD